MPALPWPPGPSSTEIGFQTLLVRTDFSRPQQWDTLLRALHTPSEEGFVAGFATIDDPQWRDATLEQLTADAPERALIIVADAVTLSSPELAALVIHLAGGSAQQLRVTPAGMWAVENNLFCSNRDWSDFTFAADADGIYRGPT
ncbi:DUF6924 domain-containing protein [Kineococcus rhizosphaerae]|uniref:DUF6924 domain-containing protein n=1 Tax=Kineococcus rhizosphaerae TaxID=559628 RepID=A0A2T0QYQ5_9ACTN|nr:hypothetical protein [Kineococcus rhizosphaerae]PRY11512.1 hypothetical protein CLV37_113136 [Kineococcus rhizosphaerae]